MKKTKRSELLKVADPLFGIAIVIIMMAQALNYAINYIVNRYYDILLRERYASWMPYIYFCTLIFFIFSITRVVLTYDKSLRESYWENRQALIFKSDFIFALHQKNLWIIIGALAAVYLVLPLNWTFKALAELFSGRKLVALAVYLPILTVLYFGAYLSACKCWSKKRNENAYSEESETKASMLLGIVYVIVPLLLVYFLPLLAGLVPLLFELLTVEVAVAVLALIVCVILAMIIRACSIRKKCIKELKKACKENQCSLSEIQDPFYSLFQLREGESFHVTVKDKTYSCKLIGSLNKRIPLIIHENGAIEFVCSTRILNFHTRKEFGYESEYKKILIVNPTPKFVYTFRGGKTVEIDNGEIIGDYKFYTASAFMRALASDALDK